MTRKKRKDQIRSIAAKTGKRPRGAANIVNREAAARARTSSGETGQAEQPATIYTLKHLYEGARMLFERRPETRTFTASVAHPKASVSDEIGPTGAVAMAPMVDITFVEDAPANWCFDGQIAFLPGDLGGGPQSIQFALLATSEDRERLVDLIVGEIRSARPWLAERVSHFRVLSGYMRGDDLVVVVSLGLLDEQEQHFAQLVAALHEADSLAATEMSKGALNLDSDTVSKRDAITAARNALTLVQDAAQTSRQKDVAVRALDRDRTWRLWEESLDRIDGSADNSMGSNRYVASIGGIDTSDESSALDQMNRQMRDITGEASAMEAMNRQMRDISGEASAMEEMNRQIADITGEASEEMNRQIGDITDSATAIEQLIRRAADMTGEGRAVAQFKPQANGIAGLGGLAAQLKRSQEQRRLLGIEGGDGEEPEPEHEE